MQHTKKNPPDFQINKFFYKNIGKSYRWIDRLVWNDTKWMDYTNNSNLETYILSENENLIGCGALKFLEEGHGEFKSIRVHNNFRNKGYGINVINHLINEAKMLKIRRVSIETGAGDFFLPARKLFEYFKFTKCKPFAHYKEDPNSCYYTLDL